MRLPWLVFWCVLASLAGAMLAWGQSPGPSVVFSFPVERATSGMVFQHVGALLPVRVVVNDGMGMASVVLSEQIASPTGPTWLDFCHGKDMPTAAGPYKVSCCWPVRAPATLAPQVVKLRAVACNLDGQCVTATTTFRADQ